MSSTNKTTNLKLSQFVGGDTPKWLDDYNSDMQKVDSLSEEVDSISTEVSTVSGKVDSLSEEVDSIISGGEQPFPGTDYVVEQGNSGIWKYRKWNSGVAECWGTEICSIVICSDELGAVYKSSSEYGNVSYPFTFKSAPSQQLSIGGAAGSGNVDSFFLKEPYDLPTADSTGYWYFISLERSVIPQDIRVNIFAIGEWK